MLSGVIRDLAGTERLSRLGGLLSRSPVLAVLFLVSALSLAGLPPSSGFWAKLGVIRAGFNAQAYLLTSIAVFVGLLTLLSMLKIWSEAFWKPAPEPPVDSPSIPADDPRQRSTQRRVFLLAPSVALVILSMAIGLFPQPLLATARRAANELLDQAAPGTSAAAIAPLSESGPPDAEVRP
jgi:multicomponent Na+:H+ antiporter subunit D